MGMGLQNNPIPACLGSRTGWDWIYWEEIPIKLLSGMALT